MVKSIKLTLLFIVTFYASYGSAVVLTNSKKLIETFIDGYSFGVDGQRFHLMLQIRHQLQQIISGGRQKKGMYSHKREMYTLEELAHLEKEYKTQQNEVGLQQLQPCLKIVKKDLDIHLTKYAQLAKGAKHYMLIFINESCQKHGRKSSILQHWAQVKEGHESAQLEEDITDFQTAYQFCLDLIHFLEDMCESCPIAQEQFKELVATAQK